MTIRFENKFLLAPMAGYTDVSFRALCAQMGADITVIPLIPALAVVRAQAAMRSLLLTAPEEREVGVQLFGNDPDTFRRAAEMLTEWKETGMLHIDFIDVNSGCPAPSLFSAGYGGALLEHPEKLTRIVQALRKGTHLPITAKIRLGVRENTVRSTIRALEEGGVDAITVHARTVVQQYGGCADWNALAEITQYAHVPIIGNGDVRTPQDAQRLCERTHVASVMIGRGALGNPGIFAAVKGRVPPSRSSSFSAYVALAERWKTPLHTMKLHVMQFCRGFWGARQLREKIRTVHTAESLRALEKEIVSRVVDSRERIEDFYNHEEKRTP